MKHRKSLFARKLMAAGLVMAMLAADVASPASAALAGAETDVSAAELAADGGEESREDGVGFGQTSEQTGEAGGTDNASDNAQETGESTEAQSAAADIPETQSTEASTAQGGGYRH